MEAGFLPTLAAAGASTGAIMVGMVNIYGGVALFAASLVLYVVVSLWWRFSVRDAKGQDQPRWDMFHILNYVALVLFGASTFFMIQEWMAAPSASPLHFFGAAPFLLAFLAWLASLTYMLAFFGVAWMHEELASPGAHLAGPPPAVPSAVKAGYDADVIVVGAGTAGTAFALRMAMDGHKVTLIERSMEIRPSVVGELMQPGGIRALETMGLDQAAKRTAIDPVQVDGYVCFTPGADRKQDLVLAYPTHDPHSVAEFVGMFDGPPPVSNDLKGPIATGFEPRPATDPALPRGRSFHNYRFVQSLRDMAAEHANITFIEGRVTALLSPGDMDASHPGAKLNGGSDKTVVGVTWLDASKTKHNVTAPLTIVADGGFSSLRKHVAEPYSVEYSSYFIGLCLNHKEGTCPLPYPRHGHVVLTDPNPTLLYQISSTETRILVDVPAPLPDPQDGSLAKYLLTVVMPQLPAATQPLFEEAVKTQNAEVCRNKRMPAQPFTRAHAVPVGDSWNMRHPLTGGGMTVALKDVCSLWEHLRGVDLTDSAAVAAAVETHRVSRTNHASTINTLANALHGVFTNPEADTKGASGTGTRARLREACMRYLSLGGAYTAGPVGLLAGLTSKPWVLVAHFFAVALYAVKHAVVPFPTLTSVQQAYDLLRVACIIIMPLLETERATPLAWPPVAALVNLFFPYRGVDINAA